MTIQDAEKIVRNNISVEWRILTGYEYMNKYVFVVKCYEGDFGFHATVDKYSGKFSDNDFCFSLEAGKHPDELYAALKTLINIDDDFES